MIDIEDFNGDCPECGSIRIRVIVKHQIVDEVIEWWECPECGYYVGTRREATLLTEHAEMFARPLRNIWQTLLRGGR